ncbi:MAG: hypothetical protein QXH51_06805 [Candidatus Bathyarchaeia archaeon]
MKYRVVVSFICESEETARRIYNAAKALSHFMLTIRRGEPAEERSFIILERCYHDEDPTKPCEVIEQITST